MLQPALPLMGVTVIFESFPLGPEGSTLTAQPLPDTSPCMPSGTVTLTSDGLFIELSSSLALLAIIIGAVLSPVCKPNVLPNASGRFDAASLFRALISARLTSPSPEPWGCALGVDSCKLATSE